jgi:transcription-repair coupling factor (superfamily II helicase)
MVMPNYTDLLLYLRRHSYQEVEQIHQSGDFLVRGDTITYWPVNDTDPYRVHFFDEELEKSERRKGDSWESVKDLPDLVPNYVDTEHGKIQPGEYIVHPHHGVGILERMETRKTVENEVKMFISLQYAGNDRLLFPFDRQDELMPYIGSRHPRLTRLYSKSWQNTKERIQKDLIKIARELLRIYAERNQSRRPAYEKADEWLEIIASQVDFDLTDDQARTWREIQKDFASDIPMDRLVCGDVGFGKTELALRAATQVMASGKQVAFIAPTTVLAEQHFAVLSKRFKDLPIVVEHVSRLTASRNAEIAAKLKEGAIDLIVGTHRLLGKDMEFKDLGLLILDEEQKFGVDQKERLKEMRPHLDVLSLSATPIPRTLSMSLSGLRSLSILRTPPQGRLPVETSINPYSDSLLREALAVEINRGGQTYVVHNRVQSLGNVQDRVCKLIKEAGRIPVLFSEGARASQKGEGEVVVAKAHGQLSEVSLAMTMTAFLGGDIDVLVASSIVEYGLDSPMANTLAVLHSEWFGLSDLYQLRGRVGRRKTQAYAHFLLGGVERSAYENTEDAMTITENAKKRLKALEEADQLGSGWSIALRDLEIRGGGNVLGHEQHGNLESIGLLLYAQLLQEEIGRQAKAQKIQLFHSNPE